MTMQDEIIRGVDATRAKIAERHEYDAKRIAAHLRERATEPRAKCEAALSRVPDVEPDEQDRIE